MSTRKRSRRRRSKPATAQAAPSTQVAPPSSRRPQPGAAAGGRSWAAVGLALLIGAFLGRMAFSIFGAGSMRLFDTALAFGIALLLAILYRRWALRLRAARRIRRAAAGRH